MDTIKIYVAHRMTARYMDDSVREAEFTTRTLNTYGFLALDPIVQEHIPDVHEILTQVSPEQLYGRWQEDKAAMKEADVMLDFMGCNLSDGVNVETGYVRFGLWKPVIRVWPGCPLNISWLEYDHIVPDIFTAMEVIQDNYGTYEKLGVWRKAMLERSLGPWLTEQHKMNGRYGIHPNIGIV